MGTKKIAYVNFKMLVWAREETPFKTPDMVEMEFPNISAGDIRKWESGKELPSITEAKKLAQMYKVPFASFFLSDLPSKKPRAYTDRRTAVGTIYGDTSYSLWREIQRMLSDRDSMIEYSEGLDWNSFVIPAIDEYKNDVVAISKAIRRYLGLETPLKSKTAFGQNPFSYYRTILERKNIIVSQISGVSLSEMKGISIYYDHFPIIAVNNQDYDRAKVFSLFHELAHIFRRSSSLCMIDFDERNDNEEKLCDRIAAEALMPEMEFLQIANTCLGNGGDWDLTSLEKVGGRFGVSPVAVLRRLYELKQMSFTEYTSVYSVLSEEFDKNRDQIDLSRKKNDFRVKYHYVYLNQHGYLFLQTIYRAYASGNISMGEMCKVLNIKTKHIGGIEQAVMFK